MNFTFNEQEFKSQAKVQSEKDLDDSLMELFEELDKKYIHK